MYRLVTFKLIQRENAIHLHSFVFHYLKLQTRQFYTLWQGCDKEMHPNCPPNDDDDILFQVKICIHYLTILWVINITIEILNEIKIKYHHPGVILITGCVFQGYGKNVTSENIALEPVYMYLDIFLLLPYNCTGLSRSIVDMFKAIVIVAG